MHPALHRAEGNAEHLRHCLIGDLAGPESEERAVFLGKPLPRRHKGSTGLGGEKGPEASRLRYEVLKPRGRSIFAWPTRLEAPGSVLPAEQIRADAPGDHEDPGIKSTPLRIESGSDAPHLKEGLLNRILGAVGVTYDCPHEKSEGSLKALDELLHRLRIATAATREELGIMISVRGRGKSFRRGVIDRWGRVGEGWLKHTLDDAQSGGGALGWAPEEHPDISSQVAKEPL